MAIFPQGGVALSLMYRKYTTLSAPCPARKWPMAMGIRIVLTGPGLFAGIRRRCAQVVEWHLLK